MMENTRSNPLAESIAAQRQYLDALAQVWLQNGAVKLCIHDTTPDSPPLAEWTASGTATAEYRAPLKYAGKVIGWLRVDAPENAAFQTRLDVDATLISKLFGAETELESLTAELIDTQDQMLALYQLSRSVRGQITLEATMDVLVQEAKRLSKVEAACMLLRVVDPDIGVVHPTDYIETDLLSAMFKRVLQEKNTVSIKTPRDISIDIFNAVMMPITMRERVVGFIGFLNKTDGFNAPDQKLLQAIGEEANIQIERLLLYQRTLDQAKMATELDLAANIQTQLLPQHIPEVDGVELFGASIQAKQVGGDFYDFVYKPGEQLTVMVGDVAGKGMSSALLMAMTRTVTRSRAKSNKNLSAGDILTAANTDLYDDYTQVTMFTTAFVGCFDPQTRDLVYANAGHAPVIYYTNGSATMLRPDNIPLGVLPDVDYIDHHLTLSPGDVLAIATDGFNEARKPGGEMLGYEKLIQAVVTCAHESAAVIARTLFDMIHLYAKGEPQADDQTLLVMKVVPSSSDGELDEHE